MPDPVKPITPAAAAATPLKTTPAAPRTMTPKPAAAAATPPARPTAPPARPAKTRPVLTAEKALRLEEPLATSSKAEIDKVKKQHEAHAPVTNIPDAPPTTPAAAVPAVLPDLPAPETPDPAPTAAAPAAPSKIKIGDKEYTPEELVAENKRLADAEAARLAAAAAPAPEPAPAPIPPPTKKEIAAREEAFVAATAAALPAAMTDEELDTVLAGGKEAVAVLSKIRQRDMATAILHARKGLANALNPIIDNILATIAPLTTQHQELAAYNVEQQFLAKHKDFAPHNNTCRQVAQELVKRFPAQVAKMTHEQFIDEVARQSDVILANEHRRWFPAQNGNWRSGTATPAPAVAAAPAATPAPATPAPAPAPAAATAARAARPPIAASPTGGGSGVTKDWTKSVAQSLRG